MKTCEHCKKKKVNLIPFSCRCLYKNLCMKCRLPSDHNCNFDYREEFKNRLEKELPQIVAIKIDKI